ncbi:two-component system response regulator [Novosphingobium sp. 9]|uniref:response regulator n=1 Tax=Novosphingobium sp. 9 TaxID=2025349 RepID=UPI0021B602D1|nr:response regulator [Novosphingobium sp. 9]
MSTVDRPVPVLLVDDVPANLLALEAVLATQGIDVLKASCGNEALELLLQHDVALALLDVQMPEMNGFELAELMRGRKEPVMCPSFS